MTIAAQSYQGHPIVLNISTLSSSKMAHHPHGNLFLLLSLLLLLLLLSLKGVSSSCYMNDDTCVFHLEISLRLTMMSGKTAVYAENGKLYAYDVTNTSNATPVSPDDVIVADGWEMNRLVMVANGKMPGPSIEVYENQNIVVHVKNNMFSSDVTIHWHGLHQSGTPWMDGVAFVTQCPIQPGQSFTYRFKAYPKGTFWYHSHTGAELGMGLVGAFIIREKKVLPMPEHIMLLQDWNHDWGSDEDVVRAANGNYKDRIKVHQTKSLDGSLFSKFLFESGLINGRGRYFYPDGSSTQSPLAVYEVEDNMEYRFRVIGGGIVYPFRVSVDDHMLSVIASDGYNLQPVMAESIIITPGERYDFVIKTNQTVANYWIRAVTLEVDVENHIGLAILRYKGAPDADPTSDRKNCTSADKCMVVNCPFAYYPEEDQTMCIRFNQLNALEDQDTPGATSPEADDIEDIFLDFAFPASVNGIRFMKPPVSALTQPKEISTLCKPGQCGEQRQCRCSGSIELKHNKVYQMVFLNMGLGNKVAHPIHMHGHSYYVVKIGYPTYNRTTGKYIADNPDINCRGDPDPNKSLCNSATWTNASWEGNNIPGLNLQTPPRKDTLIIPSRSYAVIRIRADNPGVWFMHCHIELHNIEGMAIMINESFPNQPKAPKGFPKCGDFNYDNMDESDDDNDGQFMGDKDEDDDNKKMIIILGAIIAALCLIILILAVAICCMMRRTATKAPSSNRDIQGITSKAYDPSS